MKKYRKKPVIIEAVQWTGTVESFNEVMRFSNFFITGDIFTSKLTIPTWEGSMTAEIGDWIIKGIHGEFYPCKPAIFEKTYEPVDE